MKTLVLFFIAGFSLTFKASPVEFDFNAHVTIKHNFVLEEEIGFKKVLVPFQFGTAETFVSQEELFKIPPLGIRKIIYVYSLNKGESFQIELNSKRKDSLVQLFGKRVPRLKDVFFETIIVDKEKLDKRSFNGFVIVYELSAKDNEKIFTASLEKEEKGKIAKTGFLFDTLIPYGYILPHVYRDYIPKSLLDNCETNIVQRVIERNSWKNRLIILDVTGSMNPYIVQYLLWLKLKHNEKEYQSFVFFNDGNRNAKKPIGATGGLYFSRNNLGYEHVVKTIKLAMRNGNGGDCPENNLEAVLTGIDRNKNYESQEVIMIADNWATPRDVALINKVKKPLRIILCGVYNGKVNLEYLKLARKSGGSLHTIESDLEDLVKLKEGDEFSFAGSKYKIEYGEIKLMKVH